MNEIVKVVATTEPLVAVDAPAIVVGMAENAPLAGSAATVDQALGGLLSRLVTMKELTGKAGEVTPVWTQGGVRAPLVLVVGLGPAAKLDAFAARRAGGVAARWLASKPRGGAAFALFEDQPELAESAIVGALLGFQGQDLYRSERKLHAPASITWQSVESAVVERAQILGEAINLARRLVNEPPKDLYPQSFAQWAAEVAQPCGLECEVWDQPRLESENCGSLLAVAQGSTRPPRLVILRHQGAAPAAPWLALVGKGVTFDSGGLSLKPSDSMMTMKCDMAGAAAVLGAMQAIARLRLPVNVMGLMGLVENMPSGSAVKLGDVLKARNGRTIEVQNTDAEGRLVLADVLSVAVDRGAARLIDLATLTGSCVVALGLDVAGVMTNHQAWADEVMDAARSRGEAVWQLPMYPEFGEQIQSDVADIRNTGGSRWGGAITAAKFLEEFVAGKPWVHLDIAGPAFLEKPKAWIDGGGSGCFVSTLVEIARHWKG